MIEQDDYSADSQTNARLRCDYDRIAREAEASGQCVFCNLKDKYIVTEDNGWVLTPGLFPRSTGDMLIIPRRHVERYEELYPEDHLALARLNLLGMKLLSEGLNVNSFYLLLRDGSETDKTVKHLHGHVMNYWKGLIDWHPMENIMPPIEVAERLRATLKTLKGG